MSKLSDRCEERKNEAQALADKFNALNDQSKKLETEKAQVLEQFNIKNSQYAELVALVQEEEGVETPSEVVE
jgi:predicted nuclease with TOPRIM domain